MSRIQMRHFVFLALFLSPIMLTGCKDDPTSPPPPTIRPPFADTPAQLMANFKEVYEMLDLEGYRNMLAPDFKMFLQRLTTLEFPELGETLDLVEETNITGNMFLGKPGHDAAGESTTPVSSVHCELPVQLTPWAESLPEDPLPGVTSALFGVLFEFNRASDITLYVTGQVKFYIVASDSLYQGTVHPYYRFVGMWDLTNSGWGKSNEDFTFGSVKALFR